MPKDLFSLFNPKSIAVIGASRTPNKVGSILLNNLIKSGFKGKVFPVNPNTNQLIGLDCYKDISSIGQKVDLVLLALPALKSLEVLDEIASSGCTNVVLYASGFKETGLEGEKLEDRLIEVCRKNNLNVLGPNCLGFVNNNLNLNATFSDSKNNVGKIKFISQSGAIAASIFDWSEISQIGINEFITIGNKTNISEIDVLNYFKKQSENEGAYSNFPIGMYLESISIGEEFIKICRELSKNHPIFILKPGKTSEAGEAMKSHTGSLTSEDDIFESAVKKAGVIRCNTLTEFFIATKAFSLLPYSKTQNVTVISNAGGPGVITTDEIIESGLKLSSKPIDLLGDALADKYLEYGEKYLNDSNTDSILFLLTPQTMTEIEKTAEVIAHLSGLNKKIVVSAFIGGEKVSDGIHILNKNLVPAFEFPEQAITALKYLTQYQQIQKLDTLSITNSQQASTTNNLINEILNKAILQKIESLDNISADKIINSLGIKTPESKYVSNVDEALEFAKKFNLNVVLKISGYGILHKKDIGGVYLNFKNEDELKSKFAELESILSIKKSENLSIKIQIQQKIASGIEIILGIKKDPVFGKFILFGIGGSFVEIIKDKNFIILPAISEEISRKVSESKLSQILKKENISEQSLVLTISKFIKLAESMPEGCEIEINPIILTSSDHWAVDTKIIFLQPKIQIEEKKGPKFLTAKTLENKNLTNKFFHQKFETAEPFNFEPGQYISVKVAPGTIRAYSIATRYEDRHFDLLVDSRPGGPGSLYFENLKPGDQIEFLGPFGKFILNLNDGATDILMMATGSGISAIRCLIDHALFELNLNKKIKLYWGLTSENEIFWENHFKNLSKDFPNFTYEITILKPTENWKGNSGYITDVIKSDYPDASKVSAYLCGHPAMIESVNKLLLENHCPENRIYTERFM